MPEIKVQHIVSCSSEDRNNPADNLLRPEGTHKWKCAAPGEKSISIVLQLEKASQINSIDIGNEGSAFVEILVGRSTGGGSDQDYQVLLVASTFMTPIEARNGTNRTSVRMFNSSQLSATASSQKWDRVKIVCTQPFNKTSTYGLSFIKFHSVPDQGSTNTPTTQEKKTIGFFKIKEDEGDDTVKTGNLFTNRGKIEPASPAPTSGAAAVRAASRLADASRSPSGSTTFSLPSAATTPTSSSAAGAGTPSHKKTEPSKVVKEEKKKETPSASNTREKRKHKVSDDDTEEEEEKPRLKKHPTSISSTSSMASSASGDKPTLKRNKSEPPKESPAREFHKLMSRVTFVMSGFQNPYRGELRDKAVAMGAKYKPDWGKGCTHLICAFVNTPKYKQVEGKGRIVSKKWIDDCYKQKKLLPWRSYRVGDAETPDEDSEDDYLPPAKKTITQKKKPETPQKIEKKTPVKAAVSDDDEYEGKTDSGEDTEEEVRKIKEKQSRSPKKNSTSVAPSSIAATTDVKSDIYDVETDEDEAAGPSKMDVDYDSDADYGLPELPDFLLDKHYFFYGTMKDTDRHLLTRYITAYGGEIEDYMNEKVNYVVSSAQWDSNFDDALGDNPNLVFVKPKWVYVCHDKQKLVPHQPYIVVPAE